MNRFIHKKVRKSEGFGLFLSDGFACKKFFLGYNGGTNQKKGGFICYRL